MGKILETKHGRSVIVDHSVFKDRTGLHIIELRGTCGSTLEKKRVTVGSVDGPRTKTPTTKDMQDLLDEERQKMADEVAWKESIRLALQGIE